MSRKFNTKKFIRDVLNDKYSLVIGNEIILDSNIEPSHDVHEFLLKKVNENSNVEYENYNEIALDVTEKRNPIRRLIEDEEITFSSTFVSSDLVKLLGLKLFTTILTTTTDGFLEAVLREIWGEELRVVNCLNRGLFIDTINTTVCY